MRIADQNALMDRIVHDIKDAAATTGVGGVILAFVNGVSAYDVAMKVFQMILVVLMVIHVALRILKAYADWQDYRANGGTLFGRRRVPTDPQAGGAGTKKSPGSSDED
jgi:hypothetical protein